MRSIRGDRPLNMAQTAWLAEGIHNALSFVIGDETRDTIHAGLAAHSISQRRCDFFVAQQRSPVRQGCRIEQIQSQVQICERPDTEKPSVLQVRSRLQRAIVAGIVMNCDGCGIMRVVENFQVVPFCIVCMTNQKSASIGSENCLADFVVTLRDGRFQKVADG